MSSIRDVARLAGVSISTVSRVLNESAQVSEEKRKRVRRAVGELGYVPNPAARSLLLQKTGVLGVVVPFATGEFFSEFLSGVDQTASDLKYFLLISISHRNDDDLRKAIANLNKRVDGLVVWAPEVRAVDVASLVGSTPVVFLNSLAPAEGNDLIDFDNHGGAYALVSHLARLGHRDIAYIKGPPRAADALARYSGYLAGLEAHGIPRRPDLEFAGDFTIEAGYAITPRILSATPPPTAIMAPNDQAAIGVLRALHEAGVPVPEQVSVTGFDDVPSSRYVTPTLTTVRIPVRELGELAIRRLIERLDSGACDIARELTVELVVRHSSGPPHINSTLH